MTAEGSWQEHDRLSAESDERRGAQLLRVSFERLAKLTELVATMEVLPSTSLEGDRTATSYAPIPDQVRAGLGVAIDHLHTTKLLIDDAASVTAMAPYTLVRSAVEACGTAMWILGPNKRDTRVLRSLQMTHERRRLVAVAAAELGKKNDAGMERMKKRVAEQRDARPGIADAKLKPPPISEQLADVGRFFGHASMPPLTLWRIASGLAHGNDSMMINVLERAQQAPYFQGSADFRMTISLAHFSVCYADAIAMIMTVYALADRRNMPALTPPFAHCKPFIGPELRELIALAEAQRHTATGPTSQGA